MREVGTYDQVTEKTTSSGLNDREFRAVALTGAGNVQGVSGLCGHWQSTEDILQVGVFQCGFDVRLRFDCACALKSRFKEVNKNRDGRYAVAVDIQGRHCGADWREGGWEMRAGLLLNAPQCRDRHPSVP